MAIPTTGTAGTLLSGDFPSSPNAVGNFDCGAGGAGTVLVAFVWAIGSGGAVAGLDVSYNGVASGANKGTEQHYAGSAGTVNAFWWIDPTGGSHAVSVSWASGLMSIYDVLLIPCSGAGSAGSVGFREDVSGNTSATTAAITSGVTDLVLASYDLPSQAGKRLSPSGGSVEDYDADWTAGAAAMSIYHQDGAAGTTTVVATSTDSSSIFEVALALAVHEATGGGAKATLPLIAALMQQGSH